MLRNTFVEGIYKRLQSDPDMKDSRVRSNFMLTGTITGRLASRNPNMQQIPSRDKHEYSKEIKKLYIADPGNLIVCADYSQAEVRWLAEDAKDKFLTKAFKAVQKIKVEYIKHPSKEARKALKIEGDFHKQTAAQVFGKNPQDITKDERSKSKAVVFGIVYGQTKYGLAQRIKLSVKKAEDFQNTFLGRFPQVKKYLLRNEKKGFEKGYVESSIGRRRRLDSKLVFGDYARVTEKIVDKRIQVHKRHEDNISRNAPIQSIASDMNLMAAIILQDYIVKHNKPWRIVNLVHDSIIAEVPIGDIPEYVEVAKRIMESPDIFKDFNVDLTVPFDRGRS
jgi:DNA polymerase-1